LCDGSIFFCSFIGGLLLMLHVSNKRALHARGSFTIVYVHMVLGCLKYDSKRQAFMSHYFAIY